MKQQNFVTQGAHTNSVSTLKGNNTRKHSKLSGSMALLSGVFMMCMQLLSSKANAQIATYTGTGGTSTAITYVANETGSVLQKTGFGTNSPCGSGGLSGMTNNGVTTFSTANAHAFFKITPNAGFQLNTTSLSVKLRRSASGLMKVRFAYSLDGGSTWTDDGVDHNPDNASCGAGSTVFTWGGGTLPVGITSTTNGITFAFYAYAPGATGGVFQINSIVVGGSVTAAGSCTGTPDAGTATPSPANLCGSGTSTITLTGGSSASGITYQWQSASAVGGPYSNISGATDISYTTSTISATSYYQVISTCSFGGSPATSAPATVTVNAIPVVSGPTTTTLFGTTTLSSTIGGGTWSSSNPAIASVDPTTGVVYGAATGVVTISNTSAAGCVGTILDTVTGSGFASCARNLVVLTAHGTTSAAAAVTLDEFTTAGAHIFADGIPASGANQLTISASATSEGFLTLSSDWTRLNFAGYDATIGVAGVATATGINRKIYSVDPSAVNTQVASDSQVTTFRTSNIRSAVGDGTNYYSTGNSSTAPTAGIQLSQLATPTFSTQVCASTTNTRVAEIINGQLMYTTGSAATGPIGLYTLGGIPTSITASTNVIDMAATVDTVTASPYGFSVSPDGNTAYICDDRSTGEKGIYKFTRSGSTWSFAYKLAGGAGARSIAVDYTTVPFATLYATSASGSATVRDTLIKIVDSNSSAVYVNLAVSDSGTSFRGVSFAPGCCAKIYAIGNTTICAGDSTTLVIYGNPGATVTYSINGDAPISVTLNSGGTDTIRTGALIGNSTFSLVGLTTSACGEVDLSGATPVSITVNSAPSVDDISGPGSVVVGGSILLTSDPTTGTWSASNGNATIDPVTGEVTGVTPGLDTISYTVTNNCGSTTVTTVIEIDAQRGAGNTATISASAISIYPNPANNTLYISANDNVNVTILSVDGKVVVEQKNTKSINVSSLASGVYLVKIYNSENILVKNTKFTKN